jgi:hypothetical protein
MLRRVIPYIKRSLSSGSGFEPEYQAVLDYAIANSIDTPSDSINIRNNNRVKYLKDEGLFSLFDLLYLFDQETGKSNFAKINYTNPSSYYLHGSNQPSFVSGSGFKANGTNQFFETGYNAQTNAIKFLDSPGESVSIGFKGFDFITADTAFETICGARTGNNSSQILIASDGSTGIIVDRIANLISGTTLAKSNFNNHILVSKQGASTLRGIYNNGSYVIGGQVQSSASFSSLELYLFAFNNNGAPSGYCKSGLSYFFNGGHLGGGDPNAIATTIYEIMSDTYTP